MTENDVIAIASKFVAKEAEDHARKHSVRPFSYTFGSVRPHPRLHGKWAVVFTAKTPDGHVIDGMAVVLVDDITGDAQFLH